MLVEHRLPDGDGVQLISQLRATDPEVPCIVLSGHGTIDLAVQAMKDGAENFVTKPIKTGLLEALIQRLLQQPASRKRTIVHDAREARAELDPFLGTSAAIRGLAEDARRMVAADGPLLLTGETGSGKGVLARWCHRNGAAPRGGRSSTSTARRCPASSSRASCSATSAARSPARSPPSPACSSRATAAPCSSTRSATWSSRSSPSCSRSSRRSGSAALGESASAQVSVRLIAATHHDLRARSPRSASAATCTSGIGTLPLSVPPLRERAEDIPVLVDSLLAPDRRRARPPRACGCRAPRSTRWSTTRGRATCASCATCSSARCCSCDGNTIGVRELRLHARSEAPAGHRSADRSAPGYRLTGDDLTLAELERRHIERIYEAESQNVQRAAVRLGIPRSSLYQKLARLGLLRKTRDAS